MISQNNSDLNEGSFNPSGNTLDSIIERIYFQKQPIEVFYRESCF